MPAPEITHYGCNMYLYGFRDDGIDSVTGKIIWNKRILLQMFPLIIPVVDTTIPLPDPNNPTYLIGGGGTPELNMSSAVIEWFTRLTYNSDLWRKAPFFMSMSLSGLSPASVMTHYHKCADLRDSLMEYFDCVIDLLSYGILNEISRFAIWDGIVGHRAFTAKITEPSYSQDWVNTETGEISNGYNFQLPFYCPNFSGQNWNRGFWYLVVNGDVKTLYSFYTRASYENYPWRLTIDDWSSAMGGENITNDSFFAGLFANYDPDAEDHYVQIGDPSEPSENDPTFNRIGDDIEFAEVPTLDAIETGFITLYAPTSLQNLRDLATYMWDNSLFDVDNWKKLFADPMEAILGLSLVPFPIPVSGVGAVTIGNLTTNISMGKVNKQWIEVDCGSIKVNRYWGTYLDYDPYTQVEIYLPYIGTKSLRADDIMNSNISVRYIVDIISGACVAEIKSSVVNSRSSVLYRFSGMCTAQLPVTANSYDNVLTGVTKLIGGAVGGFVSTGLGNPMGMAGGIEAAASGVIDINKPHIDRSGGVHSTAGFLSTQKPVLIFTFPRACAPKDQKHYTGYPSFITEDLATLSGYTEIEKIHIEGFTGTEVELNELETLLKGGVMF